MCLDLAIQRAEPSHQPAIAELFAVLAAAHEDHFFLPHPLTAGQAAQVANYQGEDLYAVVLCDQKAIAYGMLRGWDAGYEIPSLGISVHPNYRGQKVGLALMHYLHAAAALNGSPKIRLRVNQDNHRAKRLYQELGYRFDGDNGEYLVGYLNLQKKAA